MQEKSLWVQKSGARRLLSLVVVNMVQGGEGVIRPSSPTELDFKGVLES